MRAATSAAMAALLVVAAGCGAIAERATESVIERASDGDVDIDLSEGAVAVEDEEGNSTSFGTTTEVPEAIADVVPLPSGFEPRGTTEQSSDGRDGVTVIGALDTDDPVRVFEELESAVIDDGWEQANRSNMSGTLMNATFERDDASLTISVIGDGESEASLSVVLVQPS